MVEHLVIFQAKPGKEADMLTALTDFAAEIKKELPGIVELNVGPNYTKRSLDQGYTHALYASFRDKSVGEAYGPHPVHQKLLGKLAELTAGNTVVADFEV